MGIPNSCAPRYLRTLAVLIAVVVASCGGSGTPLPLDVELTAMKCPTIPVLDPSSLEFVDEPRVDGLTLPPIAIAGGTMNEVVIFDVEARTSQRLGVLHHWFSDIGVAAPVIAIDASPCGEGLMLIEPGQPDAKVLYRGKIDFGFTMSPDGAYLAFESGDDIRIVSTETAKMVKSKSDIMNLWSLRWTPDSQGVLWASFDGIERLDIDGRHETLLEHVSDDHWFDAPTVSPDGSQFAVIEHGDRGILVAIVDTATKAIVKRFSMAPDVSRLSWSPSGEYISALIAKECVCHGDVALATLRLSDGAVTQLSEYTAKVLPLPQWSPDSGVLLFQTYRSDGVDLYAVTPDGKTTIHLLTGSEPDQYYAAWYTPPKK